MRIIKKLLPLILSSICLFSCAKEKYDIIGDVSTSEDEISSFVPISSYDPQKDENVIKAIDELSTFFNSSKVSISAYLVVLETSQQSPLNTFYMDEDVYVQTNLQLSDVWEIKTHTQTYIAGDGFKVYKDEDNSAGFIEEHLDYNDYITPVSYDTEAEALMFYFNLAKLSSKKELFDRETLNTMSETYNINTVKAPFIATFENGKVSALGMLFTTYLSGVGDVNCMLTYYVNGYNETLTKQVVAIDEELYFKVDKTTFEYVEFSISKYIETGHGFQMGPKYLYFDKVSKKPIPEDAVIATLRVFNERKYTIDIYLSDVEFNPDTKKCLYTFAGKEFSFTLYTYDVTLKNEINTYECDALDHSPEDAIAYDFDNNLIIMESHKEAIIFDETTLSVIKEYDIDGEITQIQNLSDGYYVMTVTAEPGIYGYHDSDCSGNIYRINKDTLEITLVVSVNTYPNYIAVDKRGDILIAPGYGQHVPLYVYHSDTQTVESLVVPSQGNRLLEGTYLVYEEEKDRLIILGDGNYPHYYKYESNRWVDKGSNYQANGFHNIVFKFVYKQYFIGKFFIYDASDWDASTNKKFTDSIVSIYSPVAFAEGNYIYDVSGDSNEGVVLTRIKIGESIITSQFVYIQNNVNNISFGFAKDDVIYLYDNVQKAFFTYTF